jgi:hypothetical protein
MPTEIVLDNSTLLPIKKAAELVPYSRDYVARLAREGKIIAVQTDRQWFVDGDSLKNFYTHSVMEEEVRKRHLSLTRKAELEVKEVYREKLEAIVAARTVKQQYTMLQATLVVVCGLGAGLFISSGAGYLASYTVSTPAQVAQSLTDDSLDTLVADALEVRDWVAESSLSEVTETLPLDRGIVLLPANGGDAVVPPSEFFSDDVTVVMNGTTTGIIRSVQGGRVIEMPFVRVPETAVGVVAKSNSSNVVNP